MLSYPPSIGAATRTPAPATRTVWVPRPPPPPPPLQPGRPAASAVAATRITKAPPVPSPSRAAAGMEAGPGGRSPGQGRQVISERTCRFATVGSGRYRRPRHRPGRGQRRPRAQEKPFKITGAGVGPIGLPLPARIPRPHWAIGTATHLGKYYGEGSVETLSAAFDPATGVFTGTFQSGSAFEFEGANGDVLACDYGHYSKDGGEKVGTFTLLPTGNAGEYVAYWIADFTPTAGCTGKFKGVTGGWTMYAQSEPFILGSDDPIGYSWKGSGTLTFPKKGKK